MALIKILELFGGIATSKYADGYGVNLYENPADSQYTGNITKKIPYLIFKGYWVAVIRI